MDLDCKGSDCVLCIAVILSSGVQSVYGIGTETFKSSKVTNSEYLNAHVKVV